MLFQGIISWKSAQVSMGGGGGCFSDGGSSFLSGGYTPWGYSLDILAIVIIKGNKTIQSPVF